MKNMKFYKIFLILIFAIFIMSFVSASCNFDGSGTKEDPYNVSSAEDLNCVRNHLDTHFVQTNDIDLSESELLSGEGWVPIGDDSSKFTGGFNGDGYTIKNLYINRPSKDYQGLFGYTNGAMINNIILDNVNVLGDGYVGGLIGYNQDSTVSNSYSTGSISGSGDYVSGDFAVFGYVGGLIGYNEYSKVINCYSTCSVSGKRSVGGLIGYNQDSMVSNSYSTGSVSGTNNVGGLIGYNRSDSVILKSYSTSSVSGTSSIGGFVGNNQDSFVSKSYSTGSVSSAYAVGGFVGSNSGKIENCYSCGDVTYTVKSIFYRKYAGGFVGYNSSSSEINYCYSTGEIYNNKKLAENKSFGFSGNNLEIYKSNYWDKDTSGLTDSYEGAEGQSREDMKTQSKFVDWDFDNIWAINNEINNGYPYLKDNFKLDQTQFLDNQNGSVNTNNGVLVDIVQNNQNIIYSQLYIREKVQNYTINNETIFNNLKSMQEKYLYGGILKASSEKNIFFLPKTEDLFKDIRNIQYSFIFRFYLKDAGIDITADYDPSNNIFFESGQNNGVTCEKELDGNILKCTYNTKYSEFKAFKIKINDTNIYVLPSISDIDSDSIANTDSEENILFKINKKIFTFFTGENFEDIDLDGLEGVNLSEYQKQTYNFKIPVQVDMERDFKIYKGNLGKDIADIGFVSNGHCSAAAQRIAERNFYYYGLSGNQNHSNANYNAPDSYVNGDAWVLANNNQDLYGYEKDDTKGELNLLSEGKIQKERLAMIPGVILGVSVGDLGPYQSKINGVNGRKYTHVNLNIGDGNLVNTGKKDIKITTIDEYFKDPIQLRDVIAPKGFYNEDELKCVQAFLTGKDNLSICK